MESKDQANSSQSDDKNGNITAPVSSEDQNVVTQDMAAMSISDKTVEQQTDDKDEVKNDEKEDEEKKMEYVEWGCHNWQCDEEINEPGDDWYQGSKAWDSIEVFPSCLDEESDKAPSYSSIDDYNLSDEGKDNEKSNEKDKDKAKSLANEDDSSVPPGVIVGRLQKDKPWSHAPSKIDPNNDDDEETIVT